MSGVSADLRTRNTKFSKLKFIKIIINNYFKSAGVRRGVEGEGWRVKRKEKRHYCRHSGSVIISPRTGKTRDFQWIKEISRTCHNIRKQPRFLHIAEEMRNLAECHNSCRARKKISARNYTKSKVLVFKLARTKCYIILHIM